MTKPNCILDISGKVLADGAQTHLLKHEERNHTEWQVCIWAGTATAGTVTPTVKSYNAPNSESISDASGNAIVVTLTAGSSRTFIFKGAIDALILTPAGTNGTYGYTLIGL